MSAGDGAGLIKKSAEGRRNVEAGKALDKEASTTPVVGYAEAMPINLRVACLR
jgi:hypothetical protein